MFGIGISEIIIILIIALLVIGPDKLPDLAKKLGKSMAELKRTTDDLRDSIYLDTDKEEDNKSTHMEKESKNKNMDKVDEEPIIDQLPSTSFTKSDNNNNS